MRRLTRVTGDRLFVYVIVALATALFVWSHRSAFTLHGFADDLGLTIDLAQRAEASGRLLPDVMARVSGALWVGSTMWRPLPYASLALDAVLWGRAPAFWHATNVLLHVASAVLVGMVAARLVPTRMAVDSGQSAAPPPAQVGAVAFAVFLLIPWAPEVTLWIAGRFDGWATFTLLLAILFALKSRTLDHWLLLSVIAAAASYASKESALLLPVWLALLSYAAEVARMSATTPFNLRTLCNAAYVTLRSGRWLFAAHGLLYATYLFWRAHLFSGAAINVYATTPNTDISALATRFLAHTGFAAGLAPMAPVAAWLAAFSALSVVAVAWRNGYRPALFAGALLGLSVLAGLALYMDHPPGGGEGYRLYYLCAVGVSIALSAGLLRQSRLNTLVWLTLIVSLAVWQSRVAAEWTHASRSMRAALSALQATAARQPVADYGLVLMPDMVGHIPFARNAQGGMPAHASAASTGVDVLSRLIIFTPRQFAEWHHLARSDVVKHLTQRPDAPASPTRYYCFDADKPDLQDLGYWAPGTVDVDSWTALWRARTAAACPNLKL